MWLRRLNRPLSGLLLIGVLIVGALAYLAITDRLCTECGPTELTEGQLNPVAVEAVTKFSEFPVLWLGTEFEGYPLTLADVQYSPAPVANFPPTHRMILMYGSCDQKRQTSCAPPLAISIWAPNSPYGGGVVPGMHIDEAFARRGLPFHEDLHSVRLMTAGVAIEIQSEVGGYDRMIDAPMRRLWVCRRLGRARAWRRCFSSRRSGEHPGYGVGVAAMIRRLLAP